MYCELNKFLKIALLKKIYVEWYVHVQFFMV